MKKISILSILGLSTLAFGQINIPSEASVSVNGENVFLDASQFSEGYGISEGKGLLFPKTDLTQFEFKTDAVAPFYAPTYFDGMIVYNTASGVVNSTETESDKKGKKVNVEPGFYYFYNPEGQNNSSVSEGIWVRIGGGASTSVAGANVATGTFTHDGSNKSILGNNVPTDLKAITSIKIARIDDNGAKLEGGVAATTFYSYDKATRTIVFGQGPISTSMPAGEYSYTIEYTKQ